MAGLHQASIHTRESKPHGSRPCDAATAHNLGTLPRMAKTPEPLGDMSKRPVKSPKPPPKEVVFHTYPKLLYAWPLILFGVLATAQAV